MQPIKIGPDVKEKNPIPRNYPASGDEIGPFSKYLDRHLFKTYNWARKNGIKGKVEIRFVIDRTGKVLDIEILKGLDPKIDNDIKTVFDEMPKWKPKMKDGDAMTTPYRMNIFF